MKKILITILALIAALVMCFTFVACDNDTGNSPEGVNPGITDTGNNDPNGDGDDNKNPDDDKKPSDDDKKPSGDEDDKKPEEEGTAVSIKLNDALKVIDGMWTAKGFTATASYSMSTKQTEEFTESVAIDKRGNKVKFADEYIVDYETGYVYNNLGNGEYSFDQNLTAGDIDYVKYLITTFVGENTDSEITARYDEKTKTVKFYLNLADNVNKYLDPLYTAYSKSKKMGVMLDEYSELIFGAKFDQVYDLIEAYIKDPENTFGSVLELLEEKTGVDLEALLAEFDIDLPEEVMAAVKARKLGEAVTGAYNYIMQVVKDMIGGMMPTADSEGVDVDEGSGSAGMESVAMGLLNAMIFEKIDSETIDATLADIKSMMPFLKEFSVKSLIDMAFEKSEELDELYTVIKDGVKFKDISMTVALTVDDNKMLTGVKADFLTTHTYTGEAPESYVFLSDNDYLITAELKIEEYKTEVADFDIKFSPDATYKRAVAQVVYEFTDKDISVYYETAGNKIEIAAYTVETQTPDGKLTQIQNVPEGAFKFDEQTSSFVFDAAFVKSVLEEATAGTYLRATVKFDEDDDMWYCITLVYLNDNIEEVSAYLSDYLMSIIKNIGGNDMPGDSNVSENPSVSVPQE